MPKSNAGALYNAEKTDEAWAAYDDVPEVKFGVNFVANAMSSVVFYAVTDDLEGNPIPINDPMSPLAGTQLATEADVQMRRLAAPSGGQGEINRVASANIEVAGECYLHWQDQIEGHGEPGDIEYVAGRAEGADVLSSGDVKWTDERDAEGRKYVNVVTDETDEKGRRLDWDTEFVSRIWQRHPRRTTRADSHVLGLLSDIEALQLFVNEQKAEAKSRQAPGILLMASELDFTQDPPPAPGVDDDPPTAMPSNATTPNPFMSELLDALTTPITDPSDVSSVMPLTVAGPKDYIGPDAFRLLSLARTSDASLAERIQAKIDRIARGLNVPVEVVMGHMSTTFANAEQIDQDTFNDHVQPRCKMLADAYTDGFLVPMLERSGLFAVEQLDKVYVWFDPSAIIGQHDPAEFADDLLDKGAISMQAYRRLKGVDESDAPTRDEILLNLAMKGVVSDNLKSAFLVALGLMREDQIPKDIPPGAGGANDQPSQDTLNDPFAAPATPTGASHNGNGHHGNGAHAHVLAFTRHRDRFDLGRRLTAIDRSLRDRLMGAAESAMTRALEVAGSRLRSRPSLREQLRAVPKYRCAATVGASMVAAAGFDEDALLHGAFADLEDQFKTWVRDGGQAALDLVSERIGGMSIARREELGLRQLRNADEAWGWLNNALGDVGKQALYAPEKGAAAIFDLTGEWDPASRVPPGLIREALGRAGGVTSIGGAPGIVVPKGAHPVGGVATGDLVLNELADHGASVEAYRWVYGPAARRPFPPHVDLDGVEFSSFDDAVLSNTSGWPETSFYYPGDHNGCVCDFELAITEPTGTLAARTRSEEPVGAEQEDS